METWYLFNRFLFLIIYFWMNVKTLRDDYENTTAFLQQLVDQKNTATDSYNIIDSSLLFR